MTATERLGQGRAALAADLIATLETQIELGHPARATLRELQQLFNKRTGEIRDLLDRVPGGSLSQKAERIGITKQRLSAILTGKYLPSQNVMERLRAAAERVQ
jgi:hypothetical protein